ncbi:VWA domain-containing protein [Clostridium sporogenes]|uniref:VWA domain-containing protein n=1 Tax=Clostridium botulinum TaxID=1491 RepID=A0A6M0SXE0_CLOBO|nr:VWA domain-containing protein [Clostridium sporogenes]NFA59360.1 VWA domain-containing protein [Clostridium botulinum]NFI75332.1 VWA domain-containing protein [Clostridium sporogenes]NFL74060.1 VWA domain-containing protein [Clostridium sporogenes]NFM26147.1 VWA domain-containing protein [Clostridium sporogenes]NFP63225.1 VWA domain-containing protein [Clostridium sporogenes]
MKLNYYQVVFEEDREEEKLSTEKNDNFDDIDSILGIKKREYKKEQSVKHYEFDLDIYEDIYEVSSTMQNLVREGKKYLPIFDKLYKDIFLLLYKYEPFIYKEERMKTTSIINNRIIRNLAQTEDLRNLRKNCSLNEINSAIGCEIIGKKAVKIAKKWSKDQEKEKEQSEAINKGNNPKHNNQKTLSDLLVEMQEAEDRIKDLSQEKQELEENIENLKDNTSDLDEEDMKNKMQQIDEELENMEKQADNLDEELSDELEKSKDDIENLSKEMAEAFNEAEEEVREATSYIKDWGLGDKPNKSSKISFSDKVGALERIRKSKKLKELSDIIGRFKESALKDQKNKHKDGAVAIKSVKIGNDIIHTLPSEKMLLVNKTTKKEFYRKFNQKQLLQHELESDKLKAKGPMVICIDMSSSMKGIKEKWSKAVAIALLEIAQHQKRNFAAILFNEDATEPIIIEKDKKDPEKILDVAERFDGGGTLFETPLEKALEVIEQSKFKKADIVFITDGHSYTHPDFINKFNKMKDDKEFKVLSVLIYAGSKIGNIESLKLFSDDIITIDELAELEDANSVIAHKIFKSV